LVAGNFCGSPLIFLVRGTWPPNNFPVKKYSLGNFPNIRLHGYGRVNDIFPNDLPCIRVGPGRPDSNKPAVRDQDFG
jgi:hypothetical protein